MTINQHVIVIGGGPAGVTAALRARELGATARDETDLEQLTAEMLHVVDKTMQPEFVGLWLRQDGPKNR